MFQDYIVYEWMILIELSMNEWLTSLGTWESEIITSPPTFSVGFTGTAEGNI